MDSDPSQIPVVPIPFEHGLTYFAQSLTRGQAKIVAIGSSTTAGDGQIKAYPERLLSFLQVEFPKAEITMVNKGISGQEAPIELQRFDTDVIAEKPDLVIWQVGTNAVWQSADQKHPPSFDETTTAIRDGLVKLRNETQADVILMDLQYLPAVLTPAKKDKAIAMVEAISELARDASVNVFRRFAFMKGLYQVEQASFDRMVDPMDDDQAARQRMGHAATGVGGEARDRRRRREGTVIVAANISPREPMAREDRRLSEPLQLASFFSFANGLRPSQVCMAEAMRRSPVSIIRLLPTAARTVSSPIQIAVMVRRSTDT